ncbi:DUF4262 domain-containing protein [Nonomuraea polychroma]|uniref:DUF4262 domain-containing protein n=1 Tax=Nonomuraea polychroma TaxID=46176 RepID=UPI003D93E0FC
MNKPPGHHQVGFKGSPCRSTAMPYIPVVFLSGTIMQVTQQHCRCIICEPVNDPLNRFQEAMMGYIGEHGWGVSDIADDDIGPGWAYTVGLWHTFGLPEVATFGLDTDLRQSAVLSRLAGHGRALRLAVRQ